MAQKAKYFELTDIPKFALPNVLNLQAQLTSQNLAERVHGRGFMSYGQVYSRFDLMVAGLASDEYVDTNFNSYKADWKNKAIKEAFRLLRDHFGGKGRWFRQRTVRTFVLGFWFKTSIKGYWIYDGKVYAVLINARKTQPLSVADVRFLARGIYELHCIDDPNNPIPLIVDLGLHDGDEARKARVYEMPADEAISLEAFESSITEFLHATNLAGISLPPPPDVPHILDLFRR